MRLAILTDIHANREAFEAVLADCAGMRIDRYVFLGDIVGYGPDPAWCIDTLVEMIGAGAIAVRGNHDRAVGVPDGALNSNARRVIDWTVDRLSAAHKAVLGDLPLTVAEDDLLFVHASANDPQDWIYVTSEHHAMPSFRVSKARVIFCGHVHKPALYSHDMSGRVMGHGFGYGTGVPLIRSRRWLAVVGSCGQPRDGRPQAAWALYDTVTNELAFHRVPYDTASTVAKLRSGGLPESLAMRLLSGA